MSGIHSPQRHNDSSQGYEPYITTPEIDEAVNLAILLRRPLLIQGEPGCGKTRMARHVARTLYYPKYQDGYVDFYREWYIKSTSKAKEGLYTFDHIGRLRDAQLSALQAADPAALDRSRSPEAYIEFGPLGAAFLEERERCVVLIDEIDKADIDFPNDLLLELEEKRFFLTEITQHGQTKQVRAVQDPIVIVTSNNEKPLSQAFLRRCLYVYLEFPSRGRLIDILESHFPDSDEGLRTSAVSTFLKVRERFRQSEKNVTTSELLDWFRAISVDSTAFRKALAVNQIPFPSVLLKSMDAVSMLGTLERS